MKNNWHVMCLAIGVGLLAVSEHQFFYVNHPHLQIFLKEVGFALIIATLIGLTVDRYQREEFVKLVSAEREELKKDVFLYAYGVMVPQQIREEIKEKILKQPFYRSSLRIEWEFSEAPGHPELVIVQKKYSYTVTNNTAQMQEYPFKFKQFSAAEKELMDETQFLRLTVQPDEGVIQTFKQSDIEQADPTDPPHFHKLYKGIAIGVGKSAQVHYEVRETKRIYADDFYAPSHPTVEATSVVVRVKAPLFLEVAAICKGKALEPRTDHDPPSLYSWHIPAGLLPYQGIVISWAPRAESVATSNGGLPNQSVS